MAEVPPSIVAGDQTLRFLAAVPWFSFYHLPPLLLRLCSMVSQKQKKCFFIIFNAEMGCAPLPIGGQWAVCGQIILIALKIVLYSVQCSRGPAE